MSVFLSVRTLGWNPTWFPPVWSGQEVWKGQLPWRYKPSVMQNVSHTWKTPADLQTAVCVCVGGGAVPDLRLCSDPKQYGESGNGGLSPK